MGLVTQSNIHQQAKKGQGETNEKFDLLIAEQRRTNELLLWLGQVIQATNNVTVTQSPEGLAPGHLSS